MFFYGSLKALWKPEFGIYWIKTYGNRLRTIANHLYHGALLFVFTLVFVCFGKYVVIW